MLTSPLSHRRRGWLRPLPVAVAVDDPLRGGPFHAVLEPFPIGNVGEGAVVSNLRRPFKTVENSYHHASRERAVRIEQLIGDAVQDVVVRPRDYMLCFSLDETPFSWYNISESGDIFDNYRLPITDRAVHHVKGFSSVRYERKDAS